MVKDPFAFSGTSFEQLLCDHVTYTHDTIHLLCKYLWTRSEAKVYRTLSQALSHILHKGRRTCGVCKKSVKNPSISGIMLACFL